MTIGYVFETPLGADCARRLARHQKVTVFGGNISTTLNAENVEIAKNMEEIIESCRFIVMNCASADRLYALLFSSLQMVARLRENAIAVIDQTDWDAHHSNRVIAKMAELGIAYVDAPVFSDAMDSISEEAAILCGGSKVDFGVVKPILEAICPAVIHLGDTGCGHYGKLIVSAISASNRLITSECAAIGENNGISLEDMSKVITNSSGYNRAIERVQLATGGARLATDISLDAAIKDLRAATSLATICGAPLLLGNAVLGQLESGQMKECTSL